MNTLLRPISNFDFTNIKVGNKYTITLDRERAFPLHIAILLIDTDWNFYGYTVAHSALIKKGRTQIEFEVLSLFSHDEQKLYKDKFIETGKLTGEFT